jgi:hypothetical protein
MRIKITIALLAFMALNSFAQEISKKAVEEPLVIHSSQGTIEIKNPSECTQHRTNGGSIAINCKNQCTQTKDERNGEVLIKC